MKEEIKDQNNKFSIGMYVRTKKGIIGKYNVIKEFANVPTFNGFYETKETEKEYIDDKPFRNYDIKKASFNIIDLIEVGDYVNGSKVVNKYQNDSVVIEKEKMIYEEDGTIWSDCIEVNVKEIETIVTKEQFKSLEYEV